MSLDRYVFGGGTAVVTGAAGGMGAHIAEGLARRGSHLALADRDGADLAALAARLRERHPRLTVTEHVLDLTDPAQVEAFVADARAAHGPITLLVNNAGIAMTGRFEELDPADVDRVMAVNFRAPVQLTHLLLPDLLATPGSHIVVTSSLFGLIAPAGQSAYAASKFAVRGLGEALRAELAGRVGVTVVHPGGIRTNIARNAQVGSRVDPKAAERGKKGFEKALTFPADQAAEMIVEAVSHRKPRLLIGASAVVPDVLARVTPGHYDGIFTRLVGGGKKRKRSRGRPASGGAGAGSAGTNAPTGRSQDAAGEAAVAVATGPAGAAGLLAARLAGSSSADSAVAQGDSPVGAVRTVDVGGTPVRVRTSGPADAPVAVLVHGIGRSLEDWDETQALLSAHRRVIALDLPGFGLTPPAPPEREGRSELERFADGVVAALDALGVSGPVDLVGNSLGGAVCQYVVARHPERVRTLTLAASAGFGSEVALVLRLLGVPGLGRAMLARATPATLRRGERSLFADGAFVTRERLAHSARVAANPGRAETMLAVTREIGGVRGVQPGWRRELLDALRAHPVPTLIVWGDHDLVLPTAHLEAAARELPHARTHRFTHTGHLPQVERAEDFTALLLDFWAGA